MDSNMAGASTTANGDGWTTVPDPQPQATGQPPLTEQTMRDALFLSTTALGQRMYCYSSSKIPAQNHAAVVQMYRKGFEAKTRLLCELAIPIGANEVAYQQGGVPQPVVVAPQSYSDMIAAVTATAVGGAAPPTVGPAGSVLAQPTLRPPLQGPPVLPQPALQPAVQGPAQPQLQPPPADVLASRRDRRRSRSPRGNRITGRAMDNLFYRLTDAQPRSERRVVQKGNFVPALLKEFGPAGKEAFDNYTRDPLGNLTIVTSGKGNSSVHVYLRSDRPAPGEAPPPSRRDREFGGVAQRNVRNWEDDGMEPRPAEKSIDGMGRTDEGDLEWGSLIRYDYLTDFEVVRKVFFHLLKGVSRCPKTIVASVLRSLKNVRPKLGEADYRNALIDECLHGKERFLTSHRGKDEIYLMADPSFNLVRCVLSSGVVPLHDVPVASLEDGAVSAEGVTSVRGVRMQDVLLEVKRSFGICGPDNRRSMVEGYIQGGQTRHVLTKTRDALTFWLVLRED